MINLAFDLRCQPVAYCTPAHKNVWRKEKCNEKRECEGVSLNVGTNHVSVMTHILVVELWWVCTINVISELMKNTLLIIKLVTWAQTNVKNATCCDCCTDILHFFMCRHLSLLNLDFRMPKACSMATWAALSFLLKSLCLVVRFIPVWLHQLSCQRINWIANNVHSLWDQGLGIFFK